MESSRSRTNVYCVSRPPPNGGGVRNPDCRHGANIIITLDHNEVELNKPVFKTAKGAILLQDPVPIDHILRITLVGVPGYMLWKRPDRLVPPQRCACCLLCGREYVNGTLWCYDACWMPLTWLAVQERIQHIARVADRIVELDVCHGLNFKTLQPFLEREGSSFRNLPRGAFTSACRDRRCQLFSLASPGSRHSEGGKSFLQAASKL